MAIAIDQVTDTQAASVDMTNVSSLSWATHDVAGTNRLLVCIVHTLVDNAFVPNGASAVEWDSTGTPQALAKLIEINASSGGRDSGVEIWYLVNPNAVTNGTITITLEGTMHVASATLISFTGVDQSTPLDEAGGEGSVDAAGTDWSDTIDTATANAWVIQGITGKLAASGITQDNGQTEFNDYDTAGATDTMAWSDAYLGPIATPGTQTLGVSSMAGDDIAGALMAIKPAADAAVLRQSRLMTMGIG